MTTRLKYRPPFAALTAALLLLASVAASAPVHAARSPRLTLVDGEAKESAGSVTVIARLDRPAPWPVMASLRISGGDAQAGVDYLAPAPNLVLMPGKTEVKIVLTIRDDKTLEGEETAYIARGRVDASGRPVRLHGVNWFGLETPNLAPHGIWTRGWRQMMGQMKYLGFNIIRLPYSNALLRSEKEPNGIDFYKNSDLKGLSGLEMMDKIVAYAGVIGLRVLLDNHRITSGHGAEDSGLWHSATFSEDQWVQDLVFVAKRYKNHPAVIGLDLFNEPHNAARWDGGGQNDWRRAAIRGGNAVLAVNSKWLIILEGVAKAAGSHYWDGGNLAGARQKPIRLDRPNRLVYPTQVYPASVYAQPWLKGRNFTNNLPNVWRKHWAFLFEQQEAPVLIGEFGSHMKTAGDRAWMKALIAFLKRPVAEGRVAWTYWSWKPNSGDTGGLLTDDWESTHANKLATIRPLLPSPGTNPDHGPFRRSVATLTPDRRSPG
jgi:aryl-phospho-beta-D-glucosidase BglC (GH1 family)